ncbi:hypothetical protein [Paenibacillus sp. YYML68]|uniref:hypothetical protein n=1 Tax=Paenibacillus sp. YYML68 TaxID=2909250 RepID=UPI00248FA66D|nr:hypothetical protein [Paenibacillus sp. YYML68]
MNQPWVYVVLFGLCVIVYAMLLPKRASKSEDGSETMAKEMESAMDHFAIELEEQNKAIIQLFSETKKEYDTHTAKLAARLETLEKHNQQLQQDLSRVGFVAEQLQKQPIYAPQTAAHAGTVATASEAALESTNTPEQDQQDQPGNAPLMDMRQRYAELFALHDEGKSMDVIAKKLSMNKGEVSLILQLAKQGDSVNVN